MAIVVRFSCQCDNITGLYSVRVLLFADLHCDTTAVSMQQGFPLPDTNIDASTSVVQSRALHVTYVTYVRSSRIR